MTGIHDVLKWIQKSAVYSELFSRGYCGKLYNKPDRALGVYPLKHGDQPYRAYGGLESFEKVGISLLIHYTQNADASQYAAEKLFRWLRTLNPAVNLPQITDTYYDAVYPREDMYPSLLRFPAATEDAQYFRKIQNIDLLVPSPVFVGSDDNGVYEFVIEFELYVGKESVYHA